MTIHAKIFPDNSKSAKCLSLQNGKHLEFIPGGVEHHLEHNERLNCVEIQDDEKTFLALCAI